MHLPCKRTATDASLTSREPLSAGSLERRWAAATTRTSTRRDIAQHELVSVLEPDRYAQNPASVGPSSPRSMVVMSPKMTSLTSAQNDLSKEH